MSPVSYDPDGLPIVEWTHVTCFGATTRRCSIAALGAWFFIYEREFAASALLRRVVGLVGGLLAFGMSVMALASLHRAASETSLSQWDWVVVYAASTAVAVFSSRVVVHRIVRRLQAWERDRVPWTALGGFELTHDRGASLLERDEKGIAAKVPNRDEARRVVDVLSHEFIARRVAHLDRLA